MNSDTLYTKKPRIFFRQFEKTKSNFLQVHWVNTALTDVCLK